MTSLNRFLHSLRSVEMTIAAGRMTPAQKSRLETAPATCPFGVLRTRAGPIGGRGEVISNIEHRILNAEVEIAAPGPWGQDLRLPGNDGVGGRAISDFRLQIEGGAVRLSEL